MQVIFYDTTLLEAVGPDIISNRMLVSVKEEISKPLCSLFNVSLREKVFPSDWKIAHVIPLFNSFISNKST
jgi:hypothetical protein